MILKKLSRACKQKNICDPREAQSLVWAQAPRRSWWGVRANRQVCAQMLSCFLGTFQKPQERLFILDRGSRQSSSYIRGTFISRPSNILCTWSHSFYLCTGKKQIDATKAHQPACLDKKVLNGSSLANSHLKNQEKLSFNPSGIMVWLETISVPSWYCDSLLILKYVSLIRT